jgi:hypothetical protein
MKSGNLRAVHSRSAFALLLPVFVSSMLTCFDERGPPAKYTLVWRCHGSHIPK